MGEMFHFGVRGMRAAVERDPGLVLIERAIILKIRGRGSSDVVWV
jgi:hypothetical protein